MVSRETKRPRSFAASVQEALDLLERDGLLRSPVVVDGAGGPLISINGREVINLCSNDYLGLSTHPTIRQALRTSLLHHGAGASRHIGGTDDAHRRLEAELASFVGLPTALLFSSGYAANVGVLQALAGPDDVIFSDALNHASIIDGCRLSRAAVVVYPHRDLAALQTLLAETRPRYRTAFIVTESVFSMDGDLAPLPGLHSLASEHDAALMVDEAHALGVFGPEGRGSCAAARVEPDLLVGTLGKAFGCAGAFVATSHAPRSLIENRARSFVFSTATPPIQAAAVLAALPIVRAASDARTHVLRHVQRLRDGLAQLGYAVPQEVSHILPLQLGQPAAAMELSAQLLERGVFVHGIRPPTVPDNTSRLRITASALHTEDHLDTVLRVFSSFST